MRLLYLIVPLLVMTPSACQQNPADTPSVQYPKLDADTVVYDYIQNWPPPPDGEKSANRPELCAEFLDYNEEELLEIHRAISESDVYFTYLDITNGDVPDIWCIDYASDATGILIPAEELPFLVSVMEKLDKFQCYRLSATRPAPGENGTTGVEFYLPIAIQGKGYVYQVIDYLPAYPLDFADDIHWVSIPGHDHWYCYYHLGV